MTVYKLEFGNTSIEFATYEQASQYKATRNIESDIVEVEVKTIEPKMDLGGLLENNLKFGNNLIKTFLLDNYNLPQSFTLQQSIDLMIKFEAIIKLCQLGDVKSVLVLLPTIEVDEIFTQQRKQKYVEMIDNYLNS